jgi:general secretion pathway protein B
MSYILDALKKAERERDIAHVPTLMTVHESGSSASAGRFWMLGGIGLATIALMTWLSVLLLRPTDSTVSTLVHTNAAEVSATSPSPETQASSVTSVWHESAAIPPNRGLSAEAAPVTPPARKPPTDENRTLAPKQMQENLLPMVHSPLQPQTGVRAVPPPAGEAATTVNESASKPLSFRESIAGMTMTILLYSESKAERMVFINDRKYLEGDLVEGRYLLENITPDGAVLSYQGERHLLRSRAK